MLNSIIEIIKQNNNINNIDIKENFERVNIKASAQQIIRLSKENMEFINNEILKGRDCIIDFIININGNNINFDMEDLNDSWDDYQVSIDMNINNPNCQSEVSIDIKKEIKNKVLSIYCLKGFYEYIESITCISLLKVLEKRKYHYFEVLDKKSNIKCGTNMFCFYTKGMPITTQLNECSSKSILDIQLHNCSYSNRSIVNFEPYNFKLEGADEPNIHLIFKKLMIIFSLITIFDISEIKENIVEISLYGKSIQRFKLDYKQINIEELCDYCNIFEWIVGKDNVVDKLLIARNVIAMNLHGKTSLKISGNILAAIKSNYKIYLQDNFEKYISSKSVAISNLLDIQKQILELSNSVIDNFVKNIGAMCTFIFTLVIVNPITDGSLDDIFTKDITLISFILTILSLIFLGYTIYDINTQKENLYLLQENINTIYADILSEETLDEIIRENDYYKSSKVQLDKKIKIFTVLWLVVILLFFILSFALGRIHYNWVYEYIKSLLVCI